MSERTNMDRFRNDLNSNRNYYALIPLLDKSLVILLLQIYNLHSLVTQSTEYNVKMSTIVGTFSLAAPILTPVLYVKMLPRYRKGLLILLGRTTTLGSEYNSIKNNRGKNRPLLFTR